MTRKDAMQTQRERARPELLWYIRHAQALARWPVIDEEWASCVERRRLGETEGRDIAYLHGAGR
jgi:hypothetical protein